MFIDRTQFAYATGRLRVLETRLMSGNELERMLATPTPKEAFHVLHDLDYGQYITDDVAPQNFQVVLWNELFAVKTLLKKISPYEWFLNIVWNYYDAHNIKVLLKAKHAGKSKAEINHLLIPLGEIPPDRLIDHIFEGDKKTSLGLEEGDELRFKKIIAKADRAMREQNNPRLIDTTLDGFYFSRALKLAKKIKSAFIIDFIKQWIDFNNLKTLMRHGSALISGGHIGKKSLARETATMDESIANFSRFSPAYARIAREGYEQFQKYGSLIHLENMIENHKVDLLRTANRTDIGPEVVLAYLLGKENNAQVISAVMISKLNGIPTESARKYLKKLYTWRFIN